MATQTLTQGIISFDDDADSHGLLWGALLPAVFKVVLGKRIPSSRPAGL